VKLFSGYVIPISLKASADAIGKSVMFIITVVAARQLNPDPFAILALAMTTGWLLGVATDCGLSMHLARETARARERRRQLLFDVIALRTGLAFLAATIVTLATPSLVPGHWRIQFLVIVMAQLAGAVIETVSHYFRGLQRTGIEAAIHATQRIVTLLWSLTVLLVWRRLDYLGVALLVPALAAMVASMWVAARIASGEPAPERQPPVLTPSSFFRDIFPLGAGVLISALYFRIDVYFIQQWHGFQPVGGYNAAFRLIEALRLLPAAVMAVTFPVLVRATDAAPVRRIAGALTAVGVALAIVCAGGGSWIVPVVYGDGYAYAAPAFSILALALPLFFLNYALTHQVIGWDGHRAYLAIVTLALAANVAANVLFIPSLGLAGAAIATVVTEAVVTAGCVVALARQMGATRPLVAPVQHEGAIQ
jgi:O-antigen/teichoic acid export membrane protein